MDITGEGGVSIPSTISSRKSLWEALSSPLIPSQKCKWLESASVGGWGPSVSVRSTEEISLNIRNHPRCQGRALLCRIRSPGYLVWELANQRVPRTPLKPGPAHARGGAPTDQILGILGFPCTAATQSSLPRCYPSQSCRHQRIKGVKRR